jgi:hypothetical protein
MDIIEEYLLMHTYALITLILLADEINLPHTLVTVAYNKTHA